jgi:pre-rRNA-processing protein TSR1
MDVEIEVLAQRNDEEADDLLSTNEVDDMANEQTWPTEEELNAGAVAAGRESLPDAEKGTSPRTVRKVPKGTSAYQAAWLIDEDGAGGSDREWSDADSDGEEKPQLSFNFANEDGTKEKVVETGTAVSLPGDEEELEELAEEVASKAARFEDMDLEEEAKQCVSILLPYTRSVLC